MKPKILLEIRGGCLVAVSSNIPEGAEVFLVDHDNASWDEDTESNVITEKNYSKDFPFELVVNDVDK